MQEFQRNDPNMSNMSSPRPKGEKNAIVLAIVLFGLIVAFFVVWIAWKATALFIKTDKFSSYGATLQTTVVLETETVATAEDTTEPQTAASDLHNGIYQPGDYEVGVDIPAGLYLMVADTGSPRLNAIAEISVSSDENDKDAVLGGGWFHRNTYMLLEEGQFLHVSWANIYDTAKVDVTLNPFSGDGMYRVGKDISAGTYQLKLDEGEYVYEESAGYTIYSTMASPQPIPTQTGRYKETLEITLEDGQYVLFEDCHPVEP